MDQPVIDSLSPRERDVLRLVAAGLQSKEIAPRLGISRYRVDDLCQSACARLGVSRRIEAARLLAEHEAAPPEPLGAYPIGVLPDSTGRHQDTAVREERAVFGHDSVRHPTLFPTVVEGQHLRLSALQVLAWIAITIAALAIVGIALPPLAASVQTIANAIQPPTHH